ncbi:hypothetical protein MPC4_400001 [Methylocella tundrae]|uniref:Uncharacterized protein n=1 Tax=Methylocella tundrae TaxID=227605 RepID=A0A8B6M9K0_METTU|nr:hypothetical protein MPC1_110002 [Methylocella tundrae]VTZ51600.1 hypothetical protein MPC4_400001 [Methylocella tundrae]
MDFRPQIYNLGMQIIPLVTQMGSMAKALDPLRAIVVMDRNHPRPGSQSSQVPAHNHCN